MLPNPQNNLSSQANAYLRTRVMTASPEELRMLLLDGAVKFARQGREGLERKDQEAAYLGVSQCRNIIFELMTSVREEVDPELVANVKALYGFIYKSLVECLHEKDLVKLEQMIGLIEYERETWAMLMQKLAEERAGKPAATAARPTAAAPDTTRAPLSVQG